MQFTGGLRLLGLLTSLILCYTCMIRRFFSIETLVFLILFGFSLGNIAYTWGAMMIFTTVRYFQEQHEDNLFNVETDEC